MKLSEIKTNWEFTKNMGATSYWFEQTDDGTGKTIGPEEVLEIGCQLEAEISALKQQIELEAIVSGLVQDENDALKRITGEFGGYKVAELLKIIALDYRMPKSASASIVRRARSSWLMDFADALLTAEESNP